MKVICIGGPNDGEWHFAPDRYIIGDWVKVPQKPKMAVLDFNPEKILEIKCSYNEYRLCCFHFSKDDRYIFMVPTDWTDKQAILYKIEDKLPI